MDIDRFIEKRKLQEVKSIKVESRSGKLDSEGLFSEEIFGRLGSPIRKFTFAYINLHIKIIHPQAWDFICGLNPIVSKCLLGRKKYFINEKGDLEESPDDSFGFSGVKLFIDNFDKLNLNELGKKHPDYVKFIKTNKDKIFIDKWIVLPAGIRDVQTSFGSNKKIVTSSEVNTLYTELLQSTKIIDENMVQFLDDETLKNICNAVQKKVIEIAKWISDR